MLTQSLERSLLTPPKIKSYSPLSTNIRLVDKSLEDNGTIRFLVTGVGCDNWFCGYPNAFISIRGAKYGPIANQEDTNWVSFIFTCVLHLSIKQAPLEWISSIRGALFPMKIDESFKTKDTIEDDLITYLCQLLLRHEKNIFTHADTLVLGYLLGAKCIAGIGFGGTMKNSILAKVPHCDRNVVFFQSTNDIILSRFLKVKAIVNSTSTKFYKLDHITAVCSFLCSEDSELFLKSTQAARYMEDHTNNNFRLQYAERCALVLN